jgi:transglutaminase-like putative cysteine protease
MAAARDERTEDGRVLLLTALIVLAAVTGAAFGRLFQGSGPMWRLLMAGAVAASLAAVLERRHLLISVVAGAAGLIVMIGLIVFPRTTLLGMPTPDTLRAIGRALSRVGEHAAREFTPAAPLPSLMTAAVIAVWCASYASHALGARAGSPVLALIPPAGLLGFASYLAGGGPRLGFVLGFLLASLGVLLGSGLRRFRVWGPILAWPGSRRWRAAAGGNGREARRLVVAVTAVAILLPGLLPGFRAAPLLDLGSSGGRITINPIVDIRPSLNRDDAIELFRVRARRPAYWRLVSLERFNGRVWTSGDLEATNGEVVEAGGLQFTPGDVTFAEGSGAIGVGNREAQPLEQEIEISGLARSWLPAAYQPIAIGLPQGSARFDRARSSIVPTDDVPSGFRYQIVSQLVVPTAEELNGEEREAAQPLAVGPHTLLPANVPPRVYELARSITKDAESPYQQMLALQRHLRTFTYDEQAPAGHEINDLLFFLEESKRGYCEQFAAAMAVMVRALGYASRVAVGFLPGGVAEDRRFVVTTEQAHAWPEVYFKGFGWLAFEPTPTRSNPVAGDYLNPPAAVLGGSTSQGETALTQNSGSSQLAAAERAGGALGGPGGELPEIAPEPQRRTFPLIAVVLLAAAILFILVRSGRRRLELFRARSPEERVVAAYGLFESWAGDVGFGRRTGETPLEYQARLKRSIPFSNGHLEKVTVLTGQALYSGVVVSRTEAREAVGAAKAAARDVRRHAGKTKRVLGTLGIRR